MRNSLCHFKEGPISSSLPQAEFGRLNGHYEVPNPIHDDMSKIDNASVEATRFYKWVNSLHTEYEIYQSGETSKLLDDDRVLQLIKMGFKFREI